jgi:hypothetical protein
MKVNLETIKAWIFGNKKLATAIITAAIVVVIFLAGYAKGCNTASSNFEDVQVEDAK